MSDTVASKLALANKNLLVLQKVMATSDPINMGSKLLPTLKGVVGALNDNRKMLPNKIMYQDKNIAEQLRVIENNYLGVVQGITDKVINRKKAAKYLNEINPKLTQVISTINLYLTEAVTKSHSFGALPAEVIETQVKNLVAAADRPRPVIKLDSLSDLDKYDLFIKKLQDDLQEAKQIENKQTEEPLLIDPKQADDYVKNYIKPIENFQFNENKYDEQVGKSVMKTHHAFESVYEQLPKNIKIGKIGYMLVKAPLVAVTQNFIPDTALRKSGIKFERISSTFNPGYAPGLSPNTGSSSNYLVFMQQLLLAFPTAILKEKDAFEAKLKDALKALQKNLGSLVVVSFSNSHKIVKINDSISKVPIKRTYFANSQYPGLIFVWLMPKSMFNEISFGKYLSITLATAQGIKNQIEPESSNKKENPLVEQKAQREKDQDARIQKLAEKRAEKELITGPIEAQIEEVRKQRKSLKDEIVLLSSNIQSIEIDIAKQEHQLRTMVPGGQSYKTQLAAITVNKLAVADLKGKIDNIAKDKIPLLGKQINELNQKIKAVIKQLTQKADA